MQGTRLRAKAVRRRPWAAAQRGLLTAGRLASDVLFPRRCLTCETLLPDQPNTFICFDCVEQVEFCLDPFCSVCGRPFWTFGSSFVAPEALCGLCRTQPPPFSSARAVGLYRGYMKSLILGMKYRPEAKAAFALGRLLAEYYASLFGDVVPEAVVPVPLHTERFLQREFDQSVLMARELARMKGWPFKRWLRRTRATHRQSRLSRAGRRANVRGTFSLAFGAEPQDRTVLLVDDVLTTGATAREAARVLARSGARAVHVYTAARVE
jgi:ComF family protein